MRRFVTDIGRAVPPKGGLYRRKCPPSVYSSAPTRQPPYPPGWTSTHVSIEQLSEPWCG
jgi:hypothetical protein